MKTIIFTILVTFLIGLNYSHAQYDPHFEVGSSVITRALDNELMNFYNAHLDTQEKLDKLVLLSVVGHTDSRGSVALNQKLSEKRAASVKARLMHMGVPSNKIATSGKGESSPVTLGTTENDHAQNRRIELVLRYSNGVKTVVLSEAKCEKCKTIRNRVSLLVGHGALGTINETTKGTTREFSTEHGLVMGLQYIRDMRDGNKRNWHLGGQALTNDTFLLMIGVGY